MQEGAVLGHQCHSGKEGRNKGPRDKEEQYCMGGRGTFPGTFLFFFFFLLFGATHVMYESSQARGLPLSHNRNSPGTFFSFSHQLRIIFVFKFIFRF